MDYIPILEEQKLDLYQKNSFHSLKMNGTNNCYNYSIHP